MTTYCSFKQTLLDFANKVIAPTSDDRFIFCCRHSRVFNDKVPGYVALLDGKKASNERVLEPSDISDRALGIWRELKSILEDAEQKGNIQFMYDESGTPLTGLSIMEIYAKIPQHQRHGFG